MSRPTAALLSISLLLAACGSSVATTATSSGTTGEITGSTGAGGATSASVSTGAGGAVTSTSASVSTGAGGATSSTTAGTGGSGACAGLDNGPGTFDETLVEGLTMRSYRVHVPPSYTPGTATMVVLVFHGFLEQDTDIEAITHMDEKSDAHGFIVVYPQGEGQSWNAGACCGMAQSQMLPDVKFVGDLLDRLESDYCVDPKRVYSAGFSNGGMLSHRLACELSSRIAAIGPVSGTMAIDSCAPTRPVPVFHTHGTSDFVVPYGGGGLGGAQSVKATIDGWVKRNGCTDVAPATVFQQGDATCTAYTQCEAGASVELCSIDQGGHQWPGGESAGPGGKLSTDLDASEAMVQFFLAHPMP